MKYLLVVIVVGLCAVAEATRVRQCGGDGVKEDDKINLPACVKLPCRLRRKSDIILEIKFKPTKDLPKLTNSVQATILNIPFPFIGVDGTTACDNVFDMKGVKATCPLKSGEEYVYKNVLKVLEIYPKVKTWVHWALKDGDGKNVACFEIPTKITS